MCLFIVFDSYLQASVRPLGTGQIYRAQGHEGHVGKLQERLVQFTLVEIAGMFSRLLHEEQELLSQGLQGPVGTAVGIDWRRPEPVMKVVNTLGETADGREELMLSNFRHGSYCPPGVLPEVSLTYI